MAERPHLQRRLLAWAVTEMSSPSEFAAGNVHAVEVHTAGRREGCRVHAFGEQDAMRASSLSICDGSRCRCAQGDRTWTSAGMNRWANRVAREVLRRGGDGPEPVIARGAGGAESEVLDLLREAANTNGIKVGT